MNAVIKQDGLDNLRQQLSNALTVKVEYPFSDEAVITVSIPEPTSIEKSALTGLWGNKKVVKRYIRADSKQWNDELKKQVILSAEDWKSQIGRYAIQIEEEARKDPISFFGERV